MFVFLSFFFTGSYAAVMSIGSSWHGLVTAVPVYIVYSYPPTRRRVISRAFIRRIVANQL